jgi:hypothetical protein
MRIRPAISSALISFTSHLHAAPTR